MSYLISVLSIHAKILVSIDFEKVLWSRISFFIQQRTAIALHLVRLASTFLIEAFHMTIKRFLCSNVFEAVTQHSSVFESFLVKATAALFTFFLTVCDYESQHLHNKQE